MGLNRFASTCPVSSISTRWQLHLDDLISPHRLWGRQRGVTAGGEAGAKRRVLSWQSSTTDGSPGREWPNVGAVLSRAALHNRQQSAPVAGCGSRLAGEWPSVRARAPSSGRSRPGPTHRAGDHAVAFVDGASRARREVNGSVSMSPSTILPASTGLHSWCSRLRMEFITAWKSSRLEQMSSCVFFRHWQNP
jgi:hypothetical protein